MLIQYLWVLKASNYMPKTNYKECWWLVQVVAGDFDRGSYRNGTGYSMRNLIDLRQDGGRINQEILYDYENENSRRIREEFRQSLIRWRTIIYNEFGLAILMKSDPGATPGHGEGGYYYYLANPELLNGKGKTLKELIEFLAKTETERDSWVTVGKMEKHFIGGASSMGYLSVGGSSTYGYLSREGTSYRTILGEENLEIIQFAMQFGETLTIKYGKMKAGVNIDAPYSLEPYQLKEIEGRWYVIGNLYPLGHKESAEIAIYDLGRLQFADEENPDIMYESVKGFDIWEHVSPIDFALKRQMGKVIPIDLITHAEEFADYLSEHPFCSAQEKLKEGTFRIYTCLTYDLLIQLGAYGEELTIGLPRKEEEEKDDRYFIHKLLNFLRKTREERR